MTGGTTWSTPYIYPYLVNIVYRFVKLIEIYSRELAVFVNFRRTDGQTDDEQRAMTIAHLAFGDKK